MVPTRSTSRQHSARVRHVPLPMAGRGRYRGKLRPRHCVNNLLSLRIGAARGGRLVLHQVRALGADPRAGALSAQSRLCFPCLGFGALFTDGIRATECSTTICAGELFKRLLTPGMKVGNRTVKT